MHAAPHHDEYTLPTTTKQQAEPTTTARLRGLLLQEPGVRSAAVSISQEDDFDVLTAVVAGGDPHAIFDLLDCHRPEGARISFTYLSYA